MKPQWTLAAAIALATICASPPGTRAETQRASVISNVGIDQRLGAHIDLDLVFRDETGQAVPLRRYFGSRPVVVAPVYFSCPSLCPMTLSGLTQALKILPLKAGADFEVVVFSFDPKDTPEVAATTRARYLREYKRPDANSGLHFLTGDAHAIAQLTEAIGFRYAWDEAGQQWAHTTAILVATPEGTIAQYFYGLEYSARDLRRSLEEASAEKVGSLVERVLLYCFRYDPATGKYGLIVIRTVRIFSAGVAVGLFTLMITLFRREKRSRRPSDLG